MKGRCGLVKGRRCGLVRGKEVWSGEKEGGVVW